MKKINLDKKKTVKGISIVIVVLLAIYGLDIAVINAVKLVNKKLDNFAINRVEQRHLVDTKTIVKPVPVVVKSDVTNEINTAIKSNLSK